MMRLIKKYKNRRLYDTETSQYITIEDLQRYVMDGTLFQVLDSETSEDITSLVLLQIFVEMESGTSRFLSADMLRQLIILAQHPMSQSFKEMLKEFFAAIENPALMNPYQKMLEQWQKMFKV